MKCESTLSSSSAPTRDEERTRGLSARRDWQRRGACPLALFLLGSLTFASACVDLSRPWVLDHPPTGGSIGKGGSTGLGDGGSGGTTGTLGTGGELGTGGLVAVGGTGSGGALASGGMLGTGGETALGGSTGTVDGYDGAVVDGGGSQMDVPMGSGGITPIDGPLATGGVEGTGGVGTGGVGTGGVGTGGVGTGGVGTGGVGTGGVGTGGVGTGGVGTGGVGTGGTTATGGTTTTGYHCASAVVPTNGLVTDFSDWNATTSRWGSGTTLSGGIFTYAGNSATINAAKVEGTPQGLHITGSVPGAGYGGGGLTFMSCVTAASFTQVQFSIYGSASGCNLEMQIQTFDQRPTSQTPPGGCDQAGGESCFNFPTRAQITDVSSAIPASSPRVVRTALTDFSNWSAANAGQVVGLQWQLTSNNGCSADLTIAGARFVP
jgi:hypothetical protein